VGSSANKILGLQAKARAMATRCCSPPESSSGNLDPYNTYKVISLLEKINKAGRTVILATHDREIVNKLGKRVITIEEGKIIRDEENGRFII
jgi:cell division transport system ATP-binding protein